MRRTTCKTTWTWSVGSGCPRGTSVGFTATATPRVQREIIANLKLRQPLVWVHGFYRPNLCFAAAMEAGFVRLRPVLMTALAMVIGMLPMSLGLGEGGEQNAPLGRAVVGGLAFATIATLIFVPVVFSIIHQRRRGAGTLATGEPNAA